MRRNLLVTGVALAGLTVMASGAASAAAATPSPGGLVRHTNQRPPGPISGQAAVRATGLGRATAGTAALSSVSVRSWTKTVNDGGTSFTYRMVGKDPTVLQTSPGTTIKTQVVPVVISFPNGDTWDPTAADTCDATDAVTRTLASPVFQKHKYTFGGTTVGSVQYGDAFQRANYYTYTNPTGVNPTYHVKLAPTVLPKVTINVPAAYAYEYYAACGNQRLAAVDIDWLDAYLQGTVIPSLAASGVGVKTLPLFLLGNVVEYIGTPSNCCVLGYHNAFQTGAGVQTYALSMFDNSGDFTNVGDVSALTHEVGEWLADPWVNNATKPWGNIGQVSGCQSNLEVGDPLSGTVVNVTMNSYTYHVQEMAFTSWFFHESPSSGVNGWYSNYGTFRAAAAPCP